MYTTLDDGKALDEKRYRILSAFYFCFGTLYSANKRGCLSACFFCTCPERHCRRYHEQCSTLTFLLVECVVKSRSYRDHSSLIFRKLNIVIPRIPIFIFQKQLKKNIRIELRSLPNILPCFKILNYRNKSCFSANFLFCFDNSIRTFICLGFLGTNDPYSSRKTAGLYAEVRVNASSVCPLST